MTSDKDPLDSIWIAVVIFLIFNFWLSESEEAHLIISTTLISKEVR